MNSSEIAFKFVDPEGDPPVANSQESVKKYGPRPIEIALSVELDPMEFLPEANIMESEDGEECLPTVAETEPVEWAESLNNDQHTLSNPQGFAPGGIAALETTTSITQPQEWPLARILTPEALVRWEAKGLAGEPYRTSLGQLGEANEIRHLQHRFGFQFEFLEAAMSETNWSYLGVAPHVAQNDWEAVGRGQNPCLICQGTEKVWVPALGATTGIKLAFPTKCHCTVLLTFFRHWAAFESVSPRFKNVTLRTLEPDATLSSLPLASQAAIIATLKDHPADSYYFYGSPNLGKTHMMAALYRAALQRWAENQWITGDPTPAVWRIRASVLLDQHVAWETRDKRDILLGESAPCFGS